MRRPFKNSRPIGPLINRDYSQEEVDVLQVRRDCNPEINIEIAESSAGIDEEIFNLVEDRARFEVDDIIVGKNEGAIGTQEPITTVIDIIAVEKEVPLSDINHLVNTIESRYTVFESTVAASVEEDPEDVGIPESLPMGFNPEPTKVDES